MILKAFTDGASRGNPGESGIGVIIKDESGKPVLSLHGYIGSATNNAAEYTALLTLLKQLKNFDCTKVIVYSDSELMVRQINGQYRVRDKGLRSQFSQVLHMVQEAPYEFELKYVPREENREADRLANLGIDTKKPVAA